MQKNTAPYQNHYPFPLIPLPYAYSSKEPYIDAKTMELHHDRHLKTYVDNLNKALAPYPQYHSWTLETLIIHNAKLPDSIRKTVINNAGGVYSHNLYFMEMANKVGEPLLTAIIQKFGSLDNFKQEFTKAALSVFGSGYAWLVSDSSLNLQIIITPNQNTPLEFNLQPLLNIDVWEHAYYLKHYNLRADYIKDWLELMF